MSSHKVVIPLSGQDTMSSPSTKPQDADRKPRIAPAFQADRTDSS